MQEGRYRQLHRTVILRTHSYRHKDMQGHRRNLYLSLVMLVNLGRLEQIAPTMTRIRILVQYKAPGSGSLTRYVFLVDTTTVRIYS